MSDSDLDLIVAELDAEFTGRFPEQAIRAAQLRRDEIKPRLIELIRGATEVVRSGKVLERNGHLYAVFLLTEFGAKEALPAILEAISLPEDGPFDLFGDAVTEDLRKVLAALAVDMPEVIDALIADPAINEYVRWAAAHCYLHWVRDGRITRDEAVRKLGELLHDARMAGDGISASFLVSELVSLAPAEVLDEIRAAYDQQLIEEILVSLEHVEQSIAEGEALIQWSLEDCAPTGIEDTVAELRNWASFSGDETSTEHPPQTTRSELNTSHFDLEIPLDELKGAGVSESDDTIRGTSSKVGRNSPCPCGSGKKYKKCCGAG